MPFQNPIVPGFHPDPSVCRVGEDYYMVHSTFEYFPGVPVRHSKDLVNWQHIGHCLTRPSQLPLDKRFASGGIFAPTIRHHDGRFFMVTTNIGGGGNFIVHTDDPAGEWSEPVWVPLGGIDPSLLFEDGKCYFTSTGNGMLIAEIDPIAGKVLSEPAAFWHGTGGQHPEGPHLYKINGMYYALLAEGGTEYGHMITLARSTSPLGPWEPHPCNPILSHRSMNSAIQATGHADLIQAHDESWWLVFLAVRPVWYPPCYHLGRETFLAPVTWENGWPVVNGGQLVQLDMPTPTLAQHPWPKANDRDDFVSPALALQWTFLRNPRDADWSLIERPGFLRLRGSAVTLSDTDSPAWVGRRQEHFHCEAATHLDFEPAGDNEEAGLTVRMNDHHHYEIAVTRVAGEKHVIVRRRIGNLQVVTAARPIEAGAIELRIKSDPRTYTFAYRQGAGEWIDLDTPEIRYISTEAAGGFTGIFLAMYATGNGTPCTMPADFDWFDYQQTADME